MRKIFFFLAMICSMVLQAMPLEPKVKLIDETSACIYWDSYGTYSAAYRLIVTQEELTGNPNFWKGMHYTNDTFYVASNLIEGQLYHVYLQGIENGVIQDWVTTTFIPRAIGNLDYDHLPVKGTITVNEANQSQLSVQRGITSHSTACIPYWNASCEAYRVALEKDKEYMIMMHKRNLPAAADGVYGGLSVSVFQPGAQQGSYNDNLKIAECRESSDADWVVLHFQNDSTVVDTFLLDAYFPSKHNEGILDYEFSVEEVISFSDLVAAAQELENDELPYAASGVFSDNNKVLWDDEHGFQAPSIFSSYIEQQGVYDARAYKVRVAAEDTLFVEFGGDLKASIRFYDANTLILLKTEDESRYNYPYENGFFENETTDSLDVLVVCSFDEVSLVDAAWELRISKCECDKEPVLVMAKASAESVAIYESDGVAAAQTELAKLTLTAVDEAGNVVATINNNPFVWAIDLANNTASYEFNGQDLPLGYYFDMGMEFISVDIVRIPDLPTDIEKIETVSVPAHKVLREGQIYIVTEFGIFDLFGRKVQ